MDSLDQSKKIALKKIVEMVNSQMELNKQAYELVKKKEFYDDMGMKMEIPKLLFEVNKVRNRIQWAGIKTNIWVEAYLQTANLKYRGN